MAPTTPTREPSVTRSLWGERGRPDVQDEVVDQSTPDGGAFDAEGNQPQLVSKELILGVARLFSDELGISASDDSGFPDHILVERDGFSIRLDSYNDAYLLTFTRPSSEGGNVITYFNLSGDLTSLEGNFCTRLESDGMVQYSDVRDVVGDDVVAFLQNTRTSFRSAEAGGVIDEMVGKWGGRVKTLTRAQELVLGQKEALKRAMETSVGQGRRIIELTSQLEGLQMELDDLRARADGRAEQELAGLRTELAEVREQVESYHAQLVQKADEIRRKKNKISELRLQLVAIESDNGSSELVEALRAQISERDALVARLEGEGRWVALELGVKDKALRDSKLDYVSLKDGMQKDMDKKLKALEARIGRRDARIKVLEDPNHWHHHYLVASKQASVRGVIVAVLAGVLFVGISRPNLAERAHDVVDEIVCKIVDIVKQIQNRREMEEVTDELR